MMLRLNSPKIFQIVYYILENKKVKQVQISEATETTLGFVSRVVRWLESEMIVVKSNGHYELRSPTMLIQLISRFGTLKKIKEFTVNISEEELKEELKNKGVIFCLSSALGYYSSYVRDPAVYFYRDPEDSRIDEFIKHLETLNPGFTKINVYESLVPLKDTVTEKDGFRITKEIRTIIDMFSDNKAYLCEPLIKEIFK